MLRTLSISLLLAATSLAASPNILVINVDDLGWTDVDYLPEQEARFQTPHIRALADSGMVFNNAYAASAVCSPTRASLVTGKSPAALQLTAHIPGKLGTEERRRPKGATWRAPASLHQLPLEEVTFAELAKQHGYHTAFIGKWHLAGAGAVDQREARGAIAPEFHPDKQGFDINLGGCAYGAPVTKYIEPHRNATLPDREKGEYLTDRLADEAAHYIAQHNDNPFLLYLNFYSVHTPLAAPKERVDAMKTRGYKGKQAIYAAMLDSVDQAIGKILGTLKASGIEQNTFVFFTSDNGGLFSNEPLRDIKGTLFEGGIRVPTIAVWPGKIPADTLCEEPVISYDLLPTIASVIGHDDVPDGVEGQDLTPLFNQQPFTREQPLFWHYPHYHHGGMKSCDMGSVIRVGDWKYIRLYKNGAQYLFNLKDDLAEQNNLADEMPERVAAIRKQLEERLKASNAAMPLKESPSP